MKQRAKDQGRPLPPTTVWCAIGKGLLGELAAVPDPDIAGHWLVRPRDFRLMPDRASCKGGPTVHRLITELVAAKIGG